MPKHASIISTVIFKGLKLDKTAWDKLYFGIREDIKLGIRHGLGGGSIVGTFIDEDGTGVDGGQVQKGHEYAPYQQDKTRGGYSASTSGKRPFKFQNSSNKRCTCSRKSSRGYHRKSRF